MLGNIILLCIPTALWAFGSFCGHRNRKALFCVIFGVIMCVGGTVGAVMNEKATLDVLYTYIHYVSYDSIGSMGAPPAYMLILKICSEFTDNMNIFLAVNACIQAILAGVFVYTRCSVPYAGAVVFSAGFMLTAFVGSSFFTAALICALATKYIKERRFFRFAAMILAASCFDISAVLLIPLWFVTLIPNVYVTAVISAVLAALAAIYGDVTASVFGFFGYNLTTGTEVSVPCAVFACIAAIICLLMHRMIANRDEKLTYLIPFAALGASLSVAGIWNGMLFPVSVFLLAGALTVLAPEIYDLFHKFFGILFPDKPYTVGIAVNAACFIAVNGIYIYTLFAGCYGSGIFGQFLFGEGSL